MSSRHKPFKLDDVHLAFLAKRLRIKPFNIKNVIHQSEPDVDIDVNATISAHPYTASKLLEIWRRYEEFFLFDKALITHMLNY